MSLTRSFGGLGAVFGLTAVGGGAFGAHSLKAVLSPESLAVFETAVRYQMYHALVLLVVAESLRRSSSQRALVWAGWFFVAGIVLFSGSLYGISLWQVRWLGPITPIGGLAFLIGWVCLAVVLFRKG